MISSGYLLGIMRKTQKRRRTILIFMLDNALKARELRALWALLYALSSQTGAAESGVPTTNTIMQTQFNVHTMTPHN